MSAKHMARMEDACRTGCAFANYLIDPEGFDPDRKDFIAPEGVFVNREELDKLSPAEALWAGIQFEARGYSRLIGVNPQGFLLAQELKLPKK